MRALVFLLALAACGADGPPVAPQGAAEPGLTVTGTVRTGVAVDGG